jgi:hypothetical protein
MSDIMDIRVAEFIDQEFELDPSVMYMTTDEIEEWLGYVESEDNND